jgi:alkylation response protein AidB-like acyl-CoA dehydrogenase
MAFGNEEQKKKYLPKLATAEFIGAWGLTEPNTGSDAMRMKCVAKEDGDYWVLNGTKCWITHGKSSDVVVAIVRTGELLDSHGMTAFVIERTNPGLKAGKKENKLGMRASETAEVIFDNCRVSEDAILGKEGDGFQQAMKILDGGRISIAALGLGIAKGAFVASVKYAKEREQFGQPIAHFQAIGFKLADMAMQIEAGELLTLQAADAKNKGQKVTKLGAFAKYRESRRRAPYRGCPSPSGETSPTSRALLRAPRPCGRYVDPHARRRYRGAPSVQRSANNPSPDSDSTPPDEAGP